MVSERAKLHFLSIRSKKTSEYTCVSAVMGYMLANDRDKNVANGEDRRDYRADRFLQRHAKRRRDFQAATSSSNCSGVINRRDIRCKWKRDIATHAKPEDLNTSGRLINGLSLSKDVVFGQFSETITTSRARARDSVRKIPLRYHCAAPRRTKRSRVARRRSSLFPLTDAARRPRRREGVRDRQKEGGRARHYRRRREHPSANGGGKGRMVGRVGIHRQRRGRG